MANDVIYKGKVYDSKPSKFGKGVIISLNGEDRFVTDYLKTDGWFLAGAVDFKPGTKMHFRYKGDDKEVAIRNFDGIYHSKKEFYSDVCFYKGLTKKPKYPGYPYGGTFGYVNEYMEVKLIKNQI